MDYDHIDGIVKSIVGGEIIFEHEDTNTYIDKIWARLLAFTVLYFKYGDVKYTGKTALRISQESGQKLEATKQLEIKPIKQQQFLRQLEAQLV